MKKICRACHAILPDTILLEYKNMPKSAQFFPTEEDLVTEKGVDITLRQCPYCGLIQADGAPVPYYRDVIRATGVSEEMQKFRITKYQEWVDAYQLNGKRILEVGCGSGEYMMMMEKAGAHVVGLEHRQESVEAARENGHVVLQGFIEDENTCVDTVKYDGFYCMNFLEHIPELGAFLRGICNNLTEEAVGLVEVPNFDMMLQKMLYSEFIQDHLSYFTKQTLCHLLEANGFEVIKCESIWYDYILSAVVKKRKATDVSGFILQQSYLKKQMKQFLDKQRALGNKVAVWGAGHQALANLALLEMEQEIEYVVDSAIFKQDKYTPGTHIPVVSPGRLHDGDVQMVIIMAAGYSEEVKGIMDRDYPDIEKVIFTENGLKDE